MLYCTVDYFVYLENISIVISHIFSFDFKKVKMLFANKKTEVFSLKKVFSTKFVNQMGLF